LYFAIAIFAIYFTTDLYWWPEGGSGGEKDWVQFPTGLMFLSPLFIIWGLICLKFQTIENYYFPLKEQSKRDQKKKMIIPFMNYILLLIVSVSSSHIISTMRFREDVIQNPTYFAFLMLYFAFVFLFGLILFFLEFFSRIGQKNIFKLMNNKNLVVLSKISLILIPLVLTLVALFSVSFTRNYYKILVFVDGDIDVLSIFSNTALPLFLGVVGINLSFTELLPFFPLFFILSTSLLFIELLVNEFHLM
jgi:hypothetical protein